MPVRFLVVFMIGGLLSLVISDPLLLGVVAFGSGVVVELILRRLHV